MSVIATAYGVLSYLVFFGSILYAMGFVGNFVAPKTIDSGPAASSAEALIVNLLLVGLFAVPHSVMARPGFKAVWTRIVPASVERSTYVLVASLLLLFLFWQWRPMTSVVWHLSSPALAGFVWTLYGLGWVIALLSTFLINHFDLVGLRQVTLRLRGVEYTPVVFVEWAFYKHVRHPLYLGFVIAFWSTPHMSVGHLVFSAATTAYVFIGISLEERDLLKFHPEYAAYRARVPMLFPFGTRHSAGKTRSTP